MEHPYKGALENWSGLGLGIHRTTDAHSGNYAVLIHQWYSLIAGMLQMGECKIHSMWDEKRCKNKVNIPIAKLTGRYKFLPDTDSSYAECQVLFWRINSQQGQLDTALWIRYQFQPVQTYSYFEVPLDPEGAIGVPDSISILFVARNKAAGPHQGPIICSALNSMCNFLYLDDLQFLPPETGIKEAGKVTPWKIYPNPASNRLFLEDLDSENIDSIMIFDLLGKMLMKVPAENLNTGFICLPELLPGCYLLTIIWKNGKSGAQIITIK